MAGSERVTARAQRLMGAWAALDSDRRFAGLAAAGLLATMFLPWYEKNAIPEGGKGFVTDTVSAFGTISFVEAAIFLVSAGVLTLVVARGEGRTFHLPGGDGSVILGAGLWAALLIFYRVFDRPDVSGQSGTVGIQWGFFVAFVAAGMLAFAGQRIRVAQGRAAPSRRDGRLTRLVPPSEAPTNAAPAPRRARRPAAPNDQLAFEEPAEPPLVPGEIPRAPDRG